jgi:Ca2+-transporting ATPase
VLLDDNFATIVAAVKEGRTIHENIRRFLRFSVAGNIGKALVMLLALFLGNRIPLLPLQLLWLNFIVDGLLGLGIGLEKPEGDALTGSLELPKEGKFLPGLESQVIWLGMLMGSLGLALGSWYYFTGHEEWQTIVFTFLAVAQVFHALASRSSRDSFFKKGSARNLLLVAMSFLVVLLQLLVLYVPAVRSFFNLNPIHPFDLLVVIGTGALVFLVIEVEKSLRRKKR